MRPSASSATASRVASSSGILIRADAVVDRALGVSARAVQAGHYPGRTTGCRRPPSRRRRCPGWPAASAASTDAAARPDLRLDERDVGELDLDDHLIRPGLHAGHLGRLEHLRRAELPHHHRAHARPPPRNDSFPGNEPKGPRRAAQRAGVLGPTLPGLRVSVSPPRISPEGLTSRPVPDTATPPIEPSWSALYDVARRAAVSIATVSRVVHGQDRFAKRPGSGCSRPSRNSATSPTAPPRAYPRPPQRHHRDDVRGAGDSGTARRRDRVPAVLRRGPARRTGADS